MAFFSALGPALKLINRVMDYLQQKRLEKSIKREITRKAKEEIAVARAKVKKVLRRQRGDSDDN